jgi:hypothetical protein
MLLQNSNSNTIQQFQKLWEQMAVLNTHIPLVNKEISNLATFGDLSSLEDSLKQYTDSVVEFIPQKDKVVNIAKSIASVASLISNPVIGLIATRVVETASYLIDLQRRKI